MKHKSIATWLALLGGPLGLHRFYLRGTRDLLGWLLPVPTLLGAYGVWRLLHRGVDDRWSMLLMPLLGFTIAGCALNAIVYGLMATERWNRMANPAAPPLAAPGSSTWVTIVAVVLALLVGATALMAALALAFERLFALPLP